MAVLESTHEDEDFGLYPPQLVTVAHFETLGDIQRYRLTLRHGLVYQDTMLLNEYADPDFETAIQAAASRVNQSGRYFETPEAAAAAVFAEYETAPQQAQSAIMTDADILKRLVDTGFIAPKLLKDKTIYAKTRAVKVPALFGEVLKLTSNDEARAARIMRNNMSGIEAALNTHLSRLHNKP